MSLFGPGPPALRARLSGALAACACGGLFAAQTPDTAPAYLHDVDLTLPAQSAFADWPPAELLERAYWLPWSPASFQRAALFRRPVFFVLSVNWSEHARAFDATTLADPELRRVLNAGYVTIRANADLRPDIRERYQTGTWPVVALLLPDGLPLLSEAHDPDKAQPITIATSDREALRFLLEEGTVYWKQDPAALLRAGQAWAAGEGPPAPLAGEVALAASDSYARWLLGHADVAEGGFAGMPRFVVPALDEYGELLRARGRPELAAHARLTLGRLVASPLFDAEAGGVHRLAGPAWDDVQDEKMLEGNAALVRELVLALRGADEAALRDALARTAAFITRELARPGGGFFHARLARRTDGTTPDAVVDPLVLAGPNALAGAALVRAGLTLDDPALVEQGRGALELVLARAFQRGRGVRHVLEPGDDPRLHLTAQADVALALADAYETTGHGPYLDAAQEIVDASLRNLRQAGETTLRDHLPDAAPVGLLARPRRPLRPNMRLARAMTRLALHGRGASYRDTARAIIATHAGDLAVFNLHGVEAAVALEEWLAAPLVIRLRLPGDDPQAAAWRRAAALAPWPWTIVSHDPAATPRTPAELVWGETRRAVRRPADLPAAVRRLTRQRGSGP